MSKQTDKYRTSAVSEFSCDFSTSLMAGNVDFHIHNHQEIYLLIEGSIQYFVENICYPMTSGSLILFSDKEIHKAINTSNQPFTRLVIHINSGYIRHYCTMHTNLLSCFHRTPGSGNLVSLTSAEQHMLIDMAGEIKQAVSCPEHYGSDLTALTKLIQILLLVNKAWQRTSPNRSAPKPHRAQAIMDYVDRHLTEPMTLDSIAAALSLDKYYLSHLFKTETESSIFQYILIKRIALAKEFLLAGQTVAETCHLSGFHDYTNFIRTFHKNTGCTPGQFQRLNR